MTSVNQKLQKPKSWVKLDSTQRKTHHSIAQTVQSRRALGNFKLWPSAFSPFYSTQDRLFCLTISVNQKVQQPTPWADTRFETAKNSPWQDNWVELSATLRRMIKPSSSWYFKLWPSAFFPFHSAQDRQFWLMTSMNQKPQKPNSWVTLDDNQRKTRHNIPQNHTVWGEVSATLRTVITTFQRRTL